MIKLPKRARKSLDPLKQGIGLVVDTETTGCNPGRHGVVELALIAFAFQRGLEVKPVAILGEYATLLDPGGVEFDPIAMRTHGIRPSEFRGHLLDPEKAEGLIQGAELVIAHNANFDAGFLAPLLPSLASLPWGCSLYHLPWASWGYSRRSLSHLCEAFEIPEGGHRALGDARATLQILAKKSPLGVCHFHLLAQRLQGMPRRA